MKKSLHDNIISWLAIQENGINNHGVGQYTFEGREPDVVKIENGDPVELIEVEHITKEELPPVTKRSLYFLVEGRWDKFAVITVGPTRTEEICNLILVERKLRISIEELKVKEEALNSKIDNLRKQFCQLKLCPSCENGLIAARNARIEAVSDFRKYLDYLRETFPKNTIPISKTYPSNRVKTYMKDIQTWISEYLINGGPKN